MREHFNIQDLANTANLAVYHLTLLKVDQLIEIIIFLKDQTQTNHHENTGRFNQTIEKEREDVSGVFCFLQSDNEARNFLRRQVCFGRTVYKVATQEVCSDSGEHNVLVCFVASHYLFGHAIHMLEY